MVSGTLVFVGGMAVLALLVLMLRGVAGRSESDGDNDLEDTHGSNRRPYGVYLFPRYLQRYGAGNPTTDPDTADGWLVCAWLLTNDAHCCILNTVRKNEQ